MSKQKKESLIVTLDTETYNGLLGKLKRIAIYALGKVYYGYQFSDVEPVLLNLAKIYNVHIYIHNAEFDIRKIEELFSGDKIRWKKSLFINGKVTTLACKDYTIHDSFKILPESLEKLSGKKGFDVEHGKVDLWDEVQKAYPHQYKDKVDFLDRCDKDNELFVRYLGYDVISLYEVIQKFIQTLGMDTDDFVKCPSIASISRWVFKHGYMGVPFKIDGNAKTDYEMLCSYKWDSNLYVEDFIRTAYCGGRVEVFKIKLDKKGYHYDVNSLYPYVMRNMPEYPIGKPEYTEKPALAEQMYNNWKRTKIGLGFVRARVFVPYQHIPPLPVKKQKLCFPCGEIEGTWTYEELEYAEKECGVIIREFIAGCHFDQTYPVFKNFIDTFYKLKEDATINGNAALRSVSKFTMNVGYGYTGMRRDDKTSIDDYKNIGKYAPEDIRFCDPDLGYIEVPTEVKAEYIQCQVAAYVTSRARLVLLKALRDVEKRGGEVYYCDTDSIVSSIEFSPSIVHPSHLGYWDCESKPVKALYLKAKVYTELIYDNDKYTLNKKFKGVSRETLKDKDFNFYKYLYDKLCSNDDKYVIVEKNRTLLRSILWMKKQGLDAGYYETRSKKMNLQTMDKRIMYYKDNYTEPLYFNTIVDFNNFNFNKITPEVEYDLTRGGHR